MASIQIDMFEVQLGSAVLLQFQTGGDWVRVLADAGVKASGYRDDHVLHKLLPILDASGGRRIDLLIGTHYDEDHLVGLVPIIEHETITIGEAWLPPVANDSEPHAIDAPLDRTNLLAHHFADDLSGWRLAHYVRRKREDVEVLLAFERPDELDEDALLAGDCGRLLSERGSLAHDGEAAAQLAADLAFLREQLGTCEAAAERDHARGLDVERAPEVEDAIALARRGPTAAELFWIDYPHAFGLDRQLEIARYVTRTAPEAAAAQRLSFTEIKKSSAEDAINAAALHKVVTALHKKNIPIKTEIIADGDPRRYAWKPERRRFLPAARGGSEPVLTLLGPSNGLVRKHWNRLPVEQATRVALSFVVPIKSITPSNQLSYVMRLEHSGQGMLISGDAGCVDFKQDHRRYHEKLLGALLPLHIVQVAHHGGANAHFYRVLQAAGYPEQEEHSFLLLSHAANDKFRPSSEFRLFLLGTLDRGDDVQILSTSKPRSDKVEDFTDAFHPVVGEGGDVGDVRIVFNKSAWTVESHAVAP